MRSTSFALEALPALTEANCVTCHKTQAGQEFLKGEGPEAVRENLLAFSPNVVNLDAPASSRILTKGAHSGPALTAAQSEGILAWLMTEVEQSGPSMGPETTPQVIEMRKTNAIDLSPLGAPNSRVEFFADYAPDDKIYLNNFKVIAGEVGVYMEHPLAISWKGGTQRFPDENDTLFSELLNLAPNTTEQINGGWALFSFSNKDPISFAFKAVAPQLSDIDLNAKNGCRVVAEFTSTAREAFTTNCASCHGGGNPVAVSATDMTQLSDVTSEGQQKACNQILLRVNKNDVPGSAIFLATQPSNDTHPFTFNGDEALHSNFVKNVTPWIQKEITAP